VHLEDMEQQMTTGDVIENATASGLCQWLLCPGVRGISRSGALQPFKDDPSIRRLGSMWTMTLCRTQ